MINPTIVEGQVSGGVAQGLSTVLYERFVYDDDGQPRAITLLDYLLPTAAEVPDIEIEHLESPPQGPINFRGAGESGAVGSPAALSNAIERARALRRARHREVPRPRPHPGDDRPSGERKAWPEQLAESAVTPSLERPRKQVYSWTPSWTATGTVWSPTATSSPR